MSDKNARTTLDAQLAGAVPSQLPVNVLKDSYIRMMKHAKVDQGVWVCKSGARIKLRMVRVNVFNSADELLHANIPVGSLYCDRCDKIPTLRKGDGVYDYNLQTFFV